MAIRITVYDEKTDLTSESRLEDGDFTVIVTEPCYIRGMLDYPEIKEVLVRICNFDKSKFHDNYQ